MRCGYYSTAYLCIADRASGESESASSSYSDDEDERSAVRICSKCTQPLIGTYFEIAGNRTRYAAVFTELHLELLHDTCFLCCTCGAQLESIHTNTRTRSLAMRAVCSERCRVFARRWETFLRRLRSGSKKTAERRCSAGSAARTRCARRAGCESNQAQCRDRACCREAAAAQRKIAKHRTQTDTSTNKRCATFRANQHAAKPSCISITYLLSCIITVTLHIPCAIDHPRCTSCIRRTTAALPYAHHQRTLGEALCMS
jgi:hypothetical protein